VERIFNGFFVQGESEFDSDLADIGNEKKACDLFEMKRTKLRLLAFHQFGTLSLVVIFLHCQHRFI